MSAELVFAYGSLVREDATACRLRDFRRGWDVAMDNTETIPGYKVYEDRATGERPAVYVTFLSIRPDLGSVVDGVVYPVDPASLPSLDARERNYERREVTDLVDAQGTRVWAYVGTDEARARCAAGRARGTALVTQEYYEQVRASFERLGALAEFERTTDELRLPRRPLRRIDLP